MRKASSSQFVTPAWVKDRLSDPQTVIIDGSWYLPAMQRDAEAEYRSGHIPGAVRFDIDTVKDHTSNLPHMLPSVDEFARAVGALGIDEGMTIVVYDGAGLFSAPRVWWTFKVFGAKRVFVLEGGWPAWRKAGNPVETGAPRARIRKVFAPSFSPEQVADWRIVKSACEQGGPTIVDARSAGRFAGSAAEPRPGLRSGHIPHSLNLPFEAVIADGRLKSNAEIERAFAEAEADLSQPMILSCGSGVTASVLAIAVTEVTGTLPIVYDGSWSEWGGRSDLPIETGADDPTGLSHKRR